jgi:hypothetical protein
LTVSALVSVKHLHKQSPKSVVHGGEPRNWGLAQWTGLPL